MTDYISREDAIDYLTLNMGWNDEDGYPVDDWDERKAIIGNLVNGIPAADVRPVVRGVWIGEADGYADGELVYDVWQCSCCGRYTECDDKPEWNFCPNCGADMRGTDDGT